MAGRVLQLAARLPVTIDLRSTMTAPETMTDKENARTGPRRPKARPRWRALLALALTPAARAEAVRWHGVEHGVRQARLSDRRAALTFPATVQAPWADGLLRLKGQVPLDAPLEAMLAAQGRLAIDVAGGTVADRTLRQRRAGRPRRRPAGDGDEQDAPARRADRAARTRWHRERFRRLGLRRAGAGRPALVHHPRRSRNLQLRNLGAVRTSGRGLLQRPPAHRPAESVRRSAHLHP